LEAPYDLGPWDGNTYPDLNPKISIPLEDEQKLKLLLAKQSKIQSQIASLPPSTQFAPPSSYQRFPTITSALAIDDDRRLNLLLAEQEEIQAKIRSNAHPY
jgi:hypothetical protein